MTEYIDRNTAIAKVTALEVIEPLSTMIDVKRLLADMSAADVTPVVRCKDCRHWNRLDVEDENKRYFCNVDGMWCKPARSKNDFCSYGERKEGVE